MENGKTLNQSCPFGDHTTRFYSNLGEAPDILESKEANLHIMKILNRLADEVKKRNPTWSPVAVSEYEKIANTSHRVLEHSPASLDEIFPVSEERAFDFIFKNKIESSNSILGNALRTAFLDKENQQENKKSTTRYILGLLQKKFPDFVKTEGKELDLKKHVLNNKLVAQGEGIVITNEDFEFLKEFQNLQERFENVEDIKELNSLKNIKQIMEILLGIQLSICRVLEELRQEDPKWFEEHSIINALQEALKYNVFHQKICLFKKTNEGIRFDGVVDKVCPARNALSQIIMNQLTNRMLK